jgi:hypothetical protein
MANKLSTNGAYKMLVAQKGAITKITGIIMPKSVDGLENKLGGAFTKLKSTHFEEGQRYGFLATVIPQEKYRHQQCSMGLQSTSKSWRIRSRSPCCRSERGAAGTTRRATQRRADGVC